jgi:hypothetical protein
MLAEEWNGLGLDLGQFGENMCMGGQTSVWSHFSFKFWSTRSGDRCVFYYGWPGFWNESNVHAHVEPRLIRLDGPRDSKRDGAIFYGTESSFVFAVVLFLPRPFSSSYWHIIIIIIVKSILSLIIGIILLLFKLYVLNGNSVYLPIRSYITIIYSIQPIFEPVST